MPFLKIAVTEEFHRKLKILCAREGTTVQAYVAGLLQESSALNNSKREIKLKARSEGISTAIAEQLTEEDVPAPAQICGKPLGVDASAGVCRLPQGHKGKCPRKGSDASSEQ